MNPLARHLTAAAALGALLLFSGCFTTRSVRASPDRSDYRFTVVDKSQDLELTEKMMADLQLSAVKYLKEQNLDRDGEYLLEVKYPPESPDDTTRWVVLQIVRQPARSFTLLAAYPGADDYFPYDFPGYYSYGYPSYYRYGYGYYDPFNYGYGGYIPTAYVPGGNYKPRDKENHPPTNRPRWEGKRPDPNRSGRDNHPPRPSNPGYAGRDRSHDGNSGGSGPGHGSGGGSYSPPPPAYNPPPSPPPAAERDHNSQGEPTVAR